MIIALIEPYEDTEPLMWLTQTTIDAKRAVVAHLLENKPWTDGFDNGTMDEDGTYPWDQLPAVDPGSSESLDAWLEAFKDMNTQPWISFHRVHANDPEGSVSL